MVQRRPHRDRVGVVAVVDQEGVLRELHQLATKPREDYPGRQTGHAVQREAERHPRRDGGQRVDQVVGLGEGELETLLAPGRADEGVGLPRLDRRLDCLHLAAGAEAQQPGRALEVRRERAGICGYDGGSAGAQPVDDLGLGRRDRLDRAEQFDVDRADVGDHGDVGLCDRAELGDLPGTAHPHLENEYVGALARPQDRQGPADLRVEVLRAGMDLAWEQGATDVLDRGLARRSGDPDDGAVEPLAPGAGERLERRERIGGAEHPPALVLGRPHLPLHRQLAPPLRRDEGAPRAPSQRLCAELPAVEALAGQPDEEVALADVPRIDHGAAGTACFTARQDLRPRRGGESFPVERLQPAAAFVSFLSSSLATSRSSNGTFRPFSYSWPCSCPLPAITTMSPWPARPSAIAIAARRSCSTTTSAGASSSIPVSICSMIAAGSSERGLSEVTTATSERSAPALPIKGRFSLSLSPPAPNTEIRRPSLIRRAASSTFSSESGVCA